MSIRDAYHAALAATHNEPLAAQRVLNSLDAGTRARLSEQARQATCTTRRYGRHWYCWVQHPCLAKPFDPWPGRKWPHAVLLIFLEIEREQTALIDRRDKWLDNDRKSLS